MVLNTLLLLLLVAVYHVVRAQYDPLVNFCRRLDHQSIVLNGTLYIDGGREVFTTYDQNGTEITNHTLGNNQNLITINMSTSWDWKADFPQKEIPKLQDSTGSLSVPDMSRGALYPDPSNPNKFWLFGGSTAMDNMTFVGWQWPQPGADSLWSYDSSNNTWTAYNMSKYGISKPASGPTTSIPEKGLAFWFNGMQDNGSSAETTVLQGSARFLSGMVVLDLNNQSARNLSTTAVSLQARVRGQMVHVPLPGSDGILVLIGGGAKSTSDLTHDWKGTLVSLQSVDIFDVGSLNNASTPDGVWYSQRTSGSTPSPRIDACLVAAPAPDNSSYNIYMYGGRDGVNTYFDEVWILSLPSFQWVQVNSGYSPRYSHTCHVVGSRQMITVGGATTSNVAADCDWETKSVGVLDMSSISWGSSYNANANPYTVPDDIVRAVGGTVNGNATVGEPATGFANPKLKALFYPNSAANSTLSNSTPSTSTATSSATTSAASNKKASSTGAIAGGVIGGLAVLTIILGAILFFLQRRKQKHTTYELNSNTDPDVPQLHSNHKEPAMLGSTAVFEKYGSSTMVSELPDDREMDKKSHISRQEDQAPVEMPAGDVPRST
ncbi:related to cell wall anchored protein [Phialocephala subalpina]|uniref:Related to cell wall anchored protein n=1 Tax=Phialocephala subalpina TaxID=576137 RepID=A0A1L7XJC8_9HELO|nr:related to cell wall anchored protein [Phialocephala subalpina]